MILSIFRVTAAILAVMLLLMLMVVPARGTAAEEMEIVVREDTQLLQQALWNVAAGLGAAVCVAVIFRIVWKQMEP